jgi:L-lactate dehydrogenase complex protein LldE
MPPEIRRSPLRFLLFKIPFPETSAGHPPKFGAISGARRIPPPGFERFMKVTLFVPCFVDLMYPQVGISMVQILERLGHEVECPEEIACCGQPAYNSGYWDEARAVATKALDRFRDSEVVVIASGSCGAMLNVFYPELFAGTPQAEAAQALARKCYEFSDFLVTKLGITDLGAKFPAKATFHDGCHGLRELHIQSQPRKLLSKVKGLELVEMKETLCCGFGGTFAAKFPMISTAMGEVKCSLAEETGADYIVSNDSSCLMHIQGLLDRQGKKIKTIHLAEILAQGMAS